MLGSIATSARQYFSLVGTVSPPRYLALAFLTYYVSVLLYGIRWKLVLNGVGRDAPLGELVKAILASIFINNVTPPMSRSGGGTAQDGVGVEKGHGTHGGVSAVSIVYERILETVPVFVLFLAGMTYFSSEEPIPFVLLGGLRAYS